jgi:predicted RNA-binding protein YlqC (UPF0109 family)
LSDEQRSSQPPRRDFRRGGPNRGGGFRRDRPVSSGPGIDYRAMVEFVAKTLAEKPEEVSVEAFERGAGTVAIKVKLADADVGRFIGKAGRNIEAIRTLVRVASLRDRKRVFVDLANQLPNGHPSSHRNHGTGGEARA